MKFAKWSLLTFVLLMVSCARNRLNGNLIADLEHMERTDRITIGWIDDQTLAVIVFEGPPTLRQFSVSEQQAAQVRQDYLGENRAISASDGTDGQLSPDGTLMTYRTRDNKFVLADANGKPKRTLFGADGILTPLYWSPNEEYLMYVEKASAWEWGQCGRYLADGKEIMAYRLRDGQRSSVYEVCEGYPYTRFAWLQLPAGISLR
jgi:hypothetical protein